MAKAMKRVAKHLPASPRNGKGAVDGIGGSIKRSVWRHIKTGQASITTAQEYALIVAERNPGIHVKFITSEEICSNEECINQHWEPTEFHVPISCTVSTLMASRISW
jgi:hypothetical protein